MKSCLPPPLCLVLMVLLFLSGPVQAQRYYVKKSSVTFVSEAPLEHIEATSTGLKGVIDFGSRTFGFSIPVRSFRGFNSMLQEEHFHENYVESEKYPVSTFTGKIIDEFNPAVPGKYPVRVKGNFTIRGITRERVLKGIIEVKPNMLVLNADFMILLDDYSIRIPRVVAQKIAPEIMVTLFAELTPGK